MYTLTLIHAHSILTLNSSTSKPNTNINISIINIIKVRPVSPPLRDVTWVLIF